MEIPETVEDLADILLDQNYLADRGLATATYLALCLGRPLLLEGEAGVGKTELAKAIASAFGLQLIRLQCYEGIDANQALYDYCIAYGVPCISGKDSMKNDYHVGDTKISVPPTLLFSVLARMPDVRRAVTMDVRLAIRRLVSMDRDQTVIVVSQAMRGA